MSYWVYVLSSPLHRRQYTGHTANVELRLKDHNQGKVKTTKAFRPWEVVYVEEQATRESAIARERYLKSGGGRRYLKRLLDEKESDG